MTRLKKHKDKILLGLALIFIIAIILGWALLLTLKKPKSPIILQEPKGSQSQLGLEFFEQMEKLFRGLAP